MDKSLLKKAAFQSVALMLVVLTSSFTLSQYNTVTIEAVSQFNHISPGQVLSTLDITMEDGNNLDASTDPIGIQKLLSDADQTIAKKLGTNALIIKKPEGNQLNLTLEDLYIRKSVQITLSGLSSESFDSNMIYRFRGEELFVGDPKYSEETTEKINEEDGSVENVITKDYGNDISHGITISLDKEEMSGGYTAKAFIELDTVYAYQLYEDARYYYIDMRKPSEVYDKIIVIDPGHGGKDGGASSRYGEYLEKDLNLEIATELKKLLDNQEKIKVYYTRTKDETVYLRPRVELGNTVDCDYFVSIHCNANKVASPNGSEVLFYRNEFKGVKNSDLARLFSDELGKVTSLENKGIIERHPEELYIMDHAKVPMILIEVGYLSNNSDMNYLSKNENKKSVAEGIYNGILKAYEELPVENQ